MDVSNIISSDRELPFRRNASVLAPAKFTSMPRESTFTNRRPRIPLKKPRFELSKTQMEDLHIAFDIFDSSGCGFITIAQLRVAIRALGYEPKDSELEALVALVDESKNGRLGFDSFKYIMNVKMTQNEKDADVIKAIHLINGGHDSTTITFEKLKKVAQELGEDVNDEQLQEMLDAADRSLDAYVVQEECFQMKKSIPDFKKANIAKSL